MAIFLCGLRGKIWVMENAKDYRERYEEAAARPYRQQHLFFSRNNPAISSLVATLCLDDIDWGTTGSGSPEPSGVRRRSTRFSPRSAKP